MQLVTRNTIKKKGGIAALVTATALTAVFGYAPAKNWVQERSVRKAEEAAVAAEGAKYQAKANDVRQLVNQGKFDDAKKQLEGLKSVKGKIVYTPEFYSSMEKAIREGPARQEGARLQAKVNDVKALLEQKNYDHAEKLLAEMRQIKTKHANYNQGTLDNLAKQITNERAATIAATHTARQEQVGTFITEGKYNEANKLMEELKKDPLSKPEFFEEKRKEIAQHQHKARVSKLEKRASVLQKLIEQKQYDRAIQLFEDLKTTKGDVIYTKSFFDRMTQQLALISPPAEWERITNIDKTAEEYDLALRHYITHYSDMTYQPHAYTALVNLYAPQVREGLKGSTINLTVVAEKAHHLANVWGGISFKKIPVKPQEDLESITADIGYLRAIALPRQYNSWKGTINPSIKNKERDPRGRSSSPTLELAESSDNAQLNLFEAYDKIGSLAASNIRILQAKGQGPSTSLLLANLRGIDGWEEFEYLRRFPPQGKMTPELKTTLMQWSRDAEREYVEKGDLLTAQYLHNVRLRMQ